MKDFFYLFIIKQVPNHNEGITETQLIKMTKYAIHITFLT
jgi:hypothetical protein